MTNAIPQFETAVIAPVLFLTSFFRGILVVLAVMCVFNAVRGWYRYRKNPIDYSLGGAMVYLMMSGVLLGLLVIDQFVGFGTLF